MTESQSKVTDQHHIRSGYRIVYQPMPRRSKGSLLPLPVIMSLLVAGFSYRQIARYYDTWTSTIARCIQKARTAELKYDPADSVLIAKVAVRVGQPHHGKPGTRRYEK